MLSHLSRTPGVPLESTPNSAPLVSIPAQVQRNCCLTLCNFSIPEELEFQYRRVNELLLSILNPTRQDESIQRIAVHLCNALVCQVDNDHKEAVGKMGFVVVRVGWASPPCLPPFLFLSPTAARRSQPRPKEGFPNSECCL